MLQALIFSAGECSNILRDGCQKTASLSGSNGGINNAIKEVEGHDCNGMDFAMWVNVCV